MVLDDAQSLLASIEASLFKSQTENEHKTENENENEKEKPNNLLLGITSNTPIRHMESHLPMLESLHDRFSWFTCSQEVGHEKPSREIFDDAFENAKF